MRQIFLGIVLLSTACSGSDESEPCDLAHRQGTFVVHYEVESGDCGLLPDEVATITDPHSAGDCDLVSPDTWSSDECTNKRHISCPGSDGSTLEMITELTEHSGDSYSGTLSTTLRDPKGIPLCSGRYRVTFERR